MDLTIDSSAIWSRIAQRIEQEIPESNTYEFYDFHRLGPLRTYIELSRSIPRLGLEPDAIDFDEHNSFRMWNFSPFLLETTVSPFFLSLPIPIYCIKAHSVAFSNTRKFYVKIEPNSGHITIMHKECIRKGMQEILDELPNLQSLYLREICTTKFETCSQSSEASVSNAFKKVLEKICEFVELELQPQISHDASSSFMSRKKEKIITPDFTVYNEGVPCCIVEMKVPILIRANEIITPSSFSDTKSLGKATCQSIYSMIGSGVMRGILADSFNFILVTLNKVSIEGGKYVPSFKYFPINIDSTKSSCLEALASFMYMASKDNTKAFFEKIPKLVIPKEMNKNVNHTSNINNSGNNNIEDEYNTEETYGREITPRPSILEMNTSEKRLQLKSPRTSTPMPICKLNELGEPLQLDGKYITSVYKIKTKFIKKFLLDPVEDSEV